MKSIDDCIRWITNFTSGKFGVRPNVEDMNFFNSILHYLDKCKEYNIDNDDRIEDKRS